MSKTEIDDFEEALAMLRAVGVDAMVCNTPVAVSVSSVKCGLPSELGDESIDDYVLIPKALVGHHPEMFVPASGDSMLDAGFEDGDLLRVVKELSRMAVMSFARPVSMWDVNYAPVGGKWFYDYLQIAQDMDKLLSGEDQSAQ